MRTGTVRVVRSYAEPGNSGECYGQVLSGTVGLLDRARLIRQGLVVDDDLRIAIIYDTDAQEGRQSVDGGAMSEVAWPSSRSYRNISTGWPSWCAGPSIMSSRTDEAFTRWKPPGKATEMPESRAMARPFQCLVARFGQATLTDLLGLADHQMPVFNHLVLYVAYGKLVVT